VTFLALAALAAPLASCALGPDSPSGEKPAVTVVALPVNHLDVRYLDHSINDTVEGVREARDALTADAPDVAAARIALDRATGALAELTEFYVPLTAARDDLISAYVNHRRDRIAARDQALAAAGIQLSWVVEHTPSRERESSSQLLSLMNALADLDRSSPAFTTQLAALCQEVQNRLQNAPGVVFRPGSREPSVTGAAADNG
jgi:hypothetical protein